MSRQLAGTQLIVASHNNGKVQEFAELLAPFSIKVFAAGTLGLPEPAETGATFADNAVHKALTAAAAVSLPALADDSGLAVTALGGAPGLYSARWARAAQGFTTAMAQVNKALGNTSDRSARFICALALAWPDEHSETFEGIVEGSIVWPPRGGNGFGYDPIFQPSGHTVTFAEMDTLVKRAISHRVHAFRKLAAACLNLSEQKKQEI